MRGRKEKMQRLTRYTHDVLQPELELLEIDLHIKRILLKDIHLIEAALSMDRIVVSLDEKAKFHFASLVVQLPDLNQIMWVNPVADETVIEWLKEGAVPDKKRCLGYTDDAS